MPPYKYKVYKNKLKVNKNRGSTIDNRRLLDFFVYPGQSAGAQVLRELVPKAGLQDKYDEARPIRALKENNKSSSLDWKSRERE